MSVNVILKGGEGEITEKKSRFIATVCEVASEEEAAAFINSIKKKYYDAKHNCYAYVIENENATDTVKASDDGEPQQTAGRPMLEVINGMGLKNVCVVVTRYFGGILLGTGGLVRAYTEACKAGLKNSEIGTKKEGVAFKISTDYNSYNRIKNIIDKLAVTDLGVEYTDVCTVSVTVPKSDAEDFEKQVIEVTNGRAEFIAKNCCFYIDKIELSE